MSKDIEALRARFANGKPVMGGGSKHDRLIIKKGEAPKIRIMPGEFGPNAMFFVEQGQHWLPGKDGKDMPYACLAQLEEPEDCRVCWWWQRFSKVNKDLIEGTDAKDVEKKVKFFTAAFRKLNLRRSFVMNVVHRGKKPEDDKAVLYAAPQTVFNQIYELIEKNLEDGVYLLDEEEGFDITITREDKDNQTSYTVTAVLKARPIGEINGKRWQEAVVNLDEVLREDIEKTRKYRANMIKAVDELCEPVWKSFGKYAVNTDGDEGDEGRGHLVAEREDEDDDIPTSHDADAGRSSRDLLDDETPSFNSVKSDAGRPETIDTTDADLAEMQRKAAAFLEND